MWLEDSRWSVVDGAMTNTPPANNLVSKQKFQDYKIHAEYKVQKDSNSGIQANPENAARRPTVRITK